MFIARWTIEAKFGQKEEALSLCRKWNREIGEQVGQVTTRALTGSIGAPESRIETEVQFASLADVEKAWAAMAKLPAHQQFAKALEPHIVSGTNRWEIFRVVDR